jgi:hypothetical protein
LWRGFVMCTELQSWYCFRIETQRSVAVSGCWASQTVAGLAWVNKRPNCPGLYVTARPRCWPGWLQAAAGRRVIAYDKDGEMQTM